MGPRPRSKADCPGFGKRERVKRFVQSKGLGIDGLGPRVHLLMPISREKLRGEVSEPPNNFPLSEADSCLSLLSPLTATLIIGGAFWSMLGRRCMKEMSRDDGRRSIEFPECRLAEHW